MYDDAGRAPRNPARDPHAHALMPLSRVTAQLWGLEQLQDAYGHRGPRRRPLRAIARWIAAAFGR